VPYNASYEVLTTYNHFCACVARKVLNVLNLYTQRTQSFG